MVGYPGPASSISSRGLCSLSALDVEGPTPEGRRGESPGRGCLAGGEPCSIWEWIKLVIQAAWNWDERKNFDGDVHPMTGTRTTPAPCWLRPWRDRRVDSMSNGEPSGWERLAHG